MADHGTPQHGTPQIRGSFKRGGKVKKTGVYRVHRGEQVVPRGKVKKVEREMRKKKGRKSSGRR